MARPEGGMVTMSVQLSLRQTSTLLSFRFFSTNHGQAMKRFLEDKVCYVGPHCLRFALIWHLFPLISRVCEEQVATNVIVCWGVNPKPDASRELINDGVIA